MRGASVIVVDDKDATATQIRASAYWTHAAARDADIASSVNATGPGAYRLRDLYNQIIDEIERSTDPATTGAVLIANGSGTTTRVGKLRTVVGSGLITGA